MNDPTERLRIVVTGLIGSIPLAGLTTHYLQYVLGLRDLGHDVLYLEDTGAWYYDPISDSMVGDDRLPARYLAPVMERFAPDTPWAFVGLDGEVRGLAGSRLREFLRAADLFINVTGAGLLRDEYLDIGRRAYVDTDPGFIQMRVRAGSEDDLEHLRRHTAHFSFGCNVGRDGCGIPSLEFDWHPTVQPVWPAMWRPQASPADDAPYTTIMKWKAYEPAEVGGKKYGLKDVELLKFDQLPARSGRGFQLAIAGDPPRRHLERRGWRLTGGYEVSRSIDRYRDFIHRSRGEWSVAKNAYVETRSGWFSERSACYLVSGRPVMLQATGFEDWLPTGKGVFAFSTYEGILEAIDEIEGNYAFNCAAAREVAEDAFDSRRVLSRLIETAMG